MFDLNTTGDTRVGIDYYPDVLVFRTGHPQGVPLLVGLDGWFTLHSDLGIIRHFYLCVSYRHVFLYLLFIEEERASIPGGTPYFNTPARSWSPLPTHSSGE